MFHCGITARILLCMCVCVLLYLCDSFVNRGFLLEGVFNLLQTSSTPVFNNVITCWRFKELPDNLFSPNDQPFCVESNHKLSLTIYVCIVESSLFLVILLHFTSVISLPPGLKISGWFPLHQIYLHSTGWVYWDSNKPHTWSYVTSKGDLLLCLNTMHSMDEEIHLSRTTTTTVRKKNWRASGHLGLHSTIRDGEPDDLLKSPRSSTNQGETKSRVVAQSPITLQLTTVGKAKDISNSLHYKERCKDSLPLNPITGKELMVSLCNVLHFTRAGGIWHNKVQTWKMFKKQFYVASLSEDNDELAERVWSSNWKWRHKMIPHIRSDTVCVNHYANTGSQP